MSDHINGIKSGSYRKEIIDTLQKLVKGMPAYKRICFFREMCQGLLFSKF